jgi:outer membrane lipase/esterase
MRWASWRALLAASSIFLTIGAASADPYFTGYFAFGDSLTDNGRILRTSQTQFGTNYSPTGAIDAAFGTKLREGGRWSNGPTFFEALPGLIGVPYVAGSDYAIGGAQAIHEAPVPFAPFPGLPPPGFSISPYFAWGLPDQIQSFANTGARFGPRDLINVWIGYNDITFGASAANIIANTQSGIQSLVNLGGRQFVVFDQQTFRPGGGTAVAQAINLQLPNALVQFANEGINVHFFDVDMLLTRLRADPTVFGYAANAGTVACSQVAACAANGTANGGALENQYISVDGVHLTGKTNTLIAEFLANQLNAPLTAAPQAEAAQGTVNAYSSLLLNHLDAYRTAPGYSLKDGEYGSETRKFSFFVEGTAAGAQRDDRNGADGFLDHGGNITAGAEYRAGPGLTVGAAFNYANPGLHLSEQGAGIDLKAYQAALFASKTAPNWFADAVLTYGRTSFDLSRQGVFDTIRASTDGWGFSAAGRTGYLWDVYALQLGPLAGLTYTRVGIGAYTESGDPLLTMHVNGQDLEGLTGSAGLQLRTPLMSSTPVKGFINLTVEHDFMSDARTITTFSTTALMLPIRTDIAGQADTYGKFAGGVTADLGQGVTGLLMGEATFGRALGNDYAVTAGIKVGL